MHAEKDHAKGGGANMRLEYSINVGVCRSCCWMALGSR